MIKRIVLTCVLLIVVLTIYAQHSDSPSWKLSGLSGPYLGQEPPCITPKIFAPGIISTSGSEFTPAFTPDQNECFFTILLPSNKLVIRHMNVVDGAPIKNHPRILYQYKKVSGVLFPHAWIRVFDTVAPPHLFIVDEIQINEEISDEFFK